MKLPSVVSCDSSPGLNVLIIFQCRRELRSNFDDKSDTLPDWESPLGAARYLQELLHHERGILPFRRATLSPQIRFLDLRWLQGEVNL